MNESGFFNQPTNSKIDSEKETTKKMKNLVGKNLMCL